MRSFLFVPADSERKLAKAVDIAADALILDLEDAVSAEHKGAARETAAEFLAHERHPGGPEVWVRINGLDSGEALADLAAIVAAAPSGLLLPKAQSPRQVAQLSHYLDAFESAAGIELGQTGIMPLATETAGAIAALGDYGPHLTRLRGLTWGAEDLAAVIGATRARDDTGRWLPVFEQVQSLVLIAAAAAGVIAVETIYANYRDLEGLERSARRARQIGFAGMLAIHPDQVTVINGIFKHSDEELDFARRVVAAFANADHSGVVAVDGKMLDRPHLDQAERLLAQANRSR